MSRIEKNKSVLALGEEGTGEWGGKGRDREGSGALGLPGKGGKRGLGRGGKVRVVVLWVSRGSGELGSGELGSGGGRGSGVIGHPGKGGGRGNWGEGGKEGRGVLGNPGKGVKGKLGREGEECSWTPGQGWGKGELGMIVVFLDSRGRVGKGENWGVGWEVVFLDSRGRVGKGENWGSGEGSGVLGLQGKGELGSGEGTGGVFSELPGKGGGIGEGELGRERGG